MYNLLIVDDEYVETVTLKSLLSANCPKLQSIEVAYNGDEALNIAAKCKPDIIFMDIMMPGMDGLEASKQIRDMLPRCRIVLLTAFSVFSYAHAAISIGVDEFIVKPAEDKQIINCINKIVDSLDKESESLSVVHRHAQTMRLLEHEIILSIICNNIDLKEVDQFFDIIGFDPSCLLAIVIMIKPKNEDSGAGHEACTSRIIKRCIEGVKDALSKNCFETFATSVGETIYCFSVCKGCESSNQSTPSETLEFKLNYIIHSITNLNYSIGICHFKDKNKLYESFLQANKSCKQELVTESTFYFSDREMRNLRIYPYKKEDDMFKSVLSCRVNDALKLLEEIFIFLIEK